MSFLFQDVLLKSFTSLRCLRRGFYKPHGPHPVFSGSRLCFPAFTILTYLTKSFLGPAYFARLLTVR